MTLKKRKQSDSFLQSFTTSWCKQVLKKFPDFYFLIRYKQYFPFLMTKIKEILKGLRTALKTAQSHLCLLLQKKVFCKSKHRLFVQKIYKLRQTKLSQFVYFSLILREREETKNKYSGT